MALAQWGGATLGLLQAEQVISRDSVRLTARALVRALSNGRSGRYQISIRDPRLTEQISFTVVNAEVRIDDPPNAPADLTLTLDINTLFALVGGHTTFADAFARGDVQSGGDPAWQAALLAQ
jgi:hypothetical protein